MTQRGAITPPPLALIQHRPCGAPNPRLRMGWLRSGEHTRLACGGRRPRRPHLRIFFTSYGMRGSSRRGRRLPHARARVLPGTENGRVRRGLGMVILTPEGVSTVDLKTRQIDLVVPGTSSPSKWPKMKSSLLALVLLTAAAVDGRAEIIPF